MFGLHASRPLHTVGYYLNAQVLATGTVALLLSFGAGKCLMSFVERFKAARLVADCLLLVLFVMSAAFLAGESYNPFIYFRF